MDQNSDQPLPPPPPDERGEVQTFIPGRSPASQSGEMPGSSGSFAQLAAALLIILIVAAGIIFYQQSQSRPASSQPSILKVQKPSPPPQVPSPSPGSGAESDLRLPPLSEETDLDTLRKELNQLDVATPGAEIDQLDQEASQL